jgi:hypothetical protein
MSRYAQQWLGERKMVKVVEVIDIKIYECPPPSEPDYEIVTEDHDGNGYDITEIIKILKGREMNERKPDVATDS